MNNIIDYLQQLELSDIEAKLYLALLEIGPTTVRELSEAINIKRTTAYLYVDLLIEKGLIIKVIQGSHKLIAANKPEDSLKTLVEKKMDSAESTRSEFTTIIQQINASYPQFKDVGDAEIKYFKGVNNARKIYEEALQADELRSYIKISKTEPLFPNTAAVFGKAFKENKKLKIWEIIYDTEFSGSPSKESRSQKGRYFYKYMPKSKKLSSEDILIYDNKVAVINFRGGKTSLVLQSVDFYNNFKEIFEFLWDMLGDPIETDV